MIETIDGSTLIAIIAPLAASIIGGGLAMAWRLGGLERSVHDLVEDVSRLDTKVDLINAKADGASATASATAAAVSAIASTVQREPGARTRRDDLA